MLSELHIENIAVLKNITIAFENGFTVMTGETGAGKSIIIDSVNLLLGSRSSKELIRNGEKQALVSACFSNISDDIKAELAKLEIFCEDDENLYIQRSITQDGKTQAKINGRSVPLSLLREAGKFLINIHGQHDNQQLLNPNEHIVFLDAYANLHDLANEYYTKYTELSSLRKTLNNSIKSERDIDERTKILHFQISEIDNAKIKKNEEDELVKKREKIKNYEKIMRYAKVVNDSLKQSSQSQMSAFDLIKNSIIALEKLEDVLDDTPNLIEKLDEFCYEIEDIAQRASALLDDECDDPSSALDKIEARLDIINRIKRNYGDTLEQINEFRAKAAAQLEDLIDNENIVQKIKKDLSSKAKEAYEIAEKITEKRLQAAKKLSAQVCERLKFLDLDKVVFDVSVTPLTSENGAKKFAFNGCDNVEFLISTNTGEPLKPLSKVASGGELSRVMLALKNVLAENDKVLTLIFDEIDSGISGKTSQKIGIMLNTIGKYTQVICITHSAQIASAAKNHLKIKKSEQDNRVQTSVDELDYDGRVDEISRIMGGIEITETIKNSAKEMLDTYR